MNVTRSDRQAILDHARDTKMARSVHAYVRGNTASFYEWLAAAPVARQIPLGPPVWICGDCHLGNLGPLADSDGNVAIQIRDLDQTVIGNPALDLVRLGLSLETAARSSELPGLTTVHMIEAMIGGYSRAMEQTAGPAKRSEPDVVRTVRRQALGRRWQNLARERIGDTRPNIPLGKRFWAIETEERDAIDALFEQPDIRQRVLELADLSERDHIRVVDAAYWKKGCSSLGYLRFAVLLGLRKKGSKDEHLALVDIKEALASVAPVAKGAKMPDDAAARVVEGASATSPNLGQRMIAAVLLSKPVVLRELAPQDLKLEIEQFSRREAVGAASYLAHIVGLAHARQMTPDRRASWLGQLTKAHGDLDAPSWLWRSVVDLAGAHEIGYLDHCRRLALADSSAN